MRIRTYEEACALVREVGILPLSGFVPEHPSLEGVTAKEAWHTGDEFDPWLWRDRLAGEGVAAYGRFFKKKPVLVAIDWFPLLKAACGADVPAEERYEDGKLSRAGKLVHAVIAATPSIDAKRLRKESGLSDKEHKKEFDAALIELQEAYDVVIAGISAGRMNELGNKSGWNATCYDLADRWLAVHGQAFAKRHSKDARQELIDKLGMVCSEPALAYFKKVFK